MEKIKGFWNKLEYWKKGGLIGCFVGITFQFIIYVINSGIYGKDILEIGKFHFNDLMFHYAPLILTQSRATQIGITLLSFIVVIVWYGVIGLFLGLIFSFLNSKINKKTTRAIAFVVVILLVVLVVIFINILTMASMFAGAA